MKRLKLLIQFLKKEWSEQKTLQNFEEALEKFGAQEFKKGHKVIVEGVSILDDAVRPDKTYFNNKPVVLLGTNAFVSMKQAFDRDGRGNLLQGLGNLDSASEYIHWYAQMNRNMSTISKITNTKRNQKEVNDLLKKYGQRFLK